MGIQISGLNSWKSWGQSIKTECPSITNYKPTNKQKKHMPFQKTQQKFDWTRVENTQAVISGACFWAPGEFHDCSEARGWTGNVHLLGEPNEGCRWWNHIQAHTTAAIASHGHPSQYGVCRSDRALEACAWLVQILESWLCPYLWPSPAV